LKPFIETNRSLKADNFYPSLVGMVLIILVLIAWGIWFCSPVIPIYESTQALTVSGSEVTAQFTLDAAPNIRYKQSAYLYIYSDEPVLLTVTDVNRDTGQVNLVLQTREGLEQVMHKKGVERLDIVTSYVSPAYLVLQAAGILR